MLRATKFLKKIHSDLKRSYSAFWSRLQYYISFKDKATRTYHVYLIKLKNEFFEKIKEHIRWAMQKIGMQMKVLHNNGGGKYKNYAFNIWMKKHHIIWKPNVPYTFE